MTKVISILFLSASYLMAQGQKATQTELIEKQLKLVTERQVKHDAHIKKLSVHLKAQDVSIEKQVKEIVDLISKFKDSNDSGTRVIRHKEQAISGLTKSIKNYSDLRKKMNQELLLMLSVTQQKTFKT